MSTSSPAAKVVSVPVVNLFIKVPPSRLIFHWTFVASSSPMFLIFVLTLNKPPRIISISRVGPKVIAIVDAGEKPLSALLTSLALTVTGKSPEVVQICPALPGSPEL